MESPFVFFFSRLRLSRVVGFTQALSFSNRHLALGFSLVMLLITRSLHDYWQGRSESLQQNTPRVRITARPLPPLNTCAPLDFFQQLDALNLQHILFKEVRMRGRQLHVTATAQTLWDALSLLNALNERGAHLTPGRSFTKRQTDYLFQFAVSC